MMKQLIFLCLIIAVSFYFSSCKKEIDPSKHLLSVEYTETDSIIFNPERGFYTFNDFSSKNNNSLNEYGLAFMIKNGLSLVYTAYTMPDFRDKPISEEFLERIRKNFSLLREHGLKAVLRFRYTVKESDKPWDATEATVMQHIEQLTPILQEYADVILVMEAGFIGVWGEWYYTDNFTFQPAPTAEGYASRRRVLDALLKALPKKRMICVRYPAAKIYSFDISYEKDTVTRVKAYDGSDLSRIASHNDCFLADQDDMGTFGGNRGFRKFWQSESKYLAMGGETCGISSFAACPNTISNMEKYHWSFINSSYHPGVIGQWNAHGCITEIKKRLGYRFVLSHAEFSKNPKIGEAFECNLYLKNVGFAAPFNPRGVELVFADTKSTATYKIKLNDDPRYWFPNEAVELKHKVDLPADMPVGEYKVCLLLPDPEPTLYDKKLFNIRLANNNVWNHEKGYNELITLDFK